MDTRSQIRVAVLHDGGARMIALEHRLARVAHDLDIVVVSEEWRGLFIDGTIPADVLLLDHDRVDDVATVDRIRQARALGVRVITLTATEDPNAVMVHMAAGADAALRKRERSRSIAEQVRLAAHRDRLTRERLQP